MSDEVDEKLANGGRAIEGGEEGKVEEAYIAILGQVKSQIIAAKARCEDRKVEEIDIMILIEIGIDDIAAIITIGVGPQRVGDEN